MCIWCLKNEQIGFFCNHFVFSCPNNFIKLAKYNKTQINSNWLCSNRTKNHNNFFVMRICCTVNQRKSFPRKKTTTRVQLLDLLFFSSERIFFTLLHRDLVCNVVTQLYFVLSLSYVCCLYICLIDRLCGVFSSAPNIFAESYNFRTQYAWYE